MSGHQITFESNGGLAGCSGGLPILFSLFFLCNFRECSISLGFCYFSRHSYALGYFGTTLDSQECVILIYIDNRHKKFLIAAALQP